MINFMVPLQLGLIIGLIVGVALNLSKHRQKMRAEFYSLEEQISLDFDSLHTQLRLDHMMLMKALKGDSYAGTVGGVEVHTDTLLPADHMFLRSKDFGGLIDSSAEQKKQQQQ